MKTLLTFLIAIVAMIFGPSANAQMAALAAGHTVTIELKAPSADKPAVDGTYTVSPRGTIKLSYIGEVQASGLTPNDLARRIEAAYKTAEIYTNPTIVAGIGPGNAPQANNIVNVTGEVGSRGREVPLRDGMRLIAAIGAAGGFTEFSDVRHVKIIRGNREMIYDMRKLEANGANNPVLQPNDLIVVKQD